MNRLKRINWYLFIVVVVYNMLDAWHTKLLLATGVIVEANQVMNWSIVNYGINSLFYIKAVEMVILAVLIYILHRKTN